MVEYVKFMAGYYFRTHVKHKTLKVTKDISMF